MNDIMEKIGLDEARQLLLKAVETQGRDFVYNPGARGGCYNVPKTCWGMDDPRAKTGCLVGTAMKLSGRIQDMQLYGEGPVWSTFQDFLTRSAGEYLSAAQNAQDGGESWGQAYDRAEASLQYLGLGWGRDMYDVST